MVDKKSKYPGPVRLSDITSSKDRKRSRPQKSELGTSAHVGATTADEKPNQVYSENAGQKTQHCKKKPYHTKRQTQKRAFGIDINADLTENISSITADPHAPQIWQGKISMIEVQKKNKERYNIYIDQAFAFGVSEATLVRFALHKGQELTPNEVNAIYQSERESSAYNVAVRFISRRLRSKKEVVDKLKEAEVPDDLIETTLSKLEDLNLINDMIYGQSYTRTAARINQKGPNLISRELKQKGLSEGDIVMSLEEYDQVQQLTNAKVLAEKQYLKQMHKSSMRESEQKTKAFLMQKGYDSDIIQNVLSKIHEEMQDVDQEEAALQKQIEKYWRKYRNLSVSDRTWKIKGVLYGKGFDKDTIGHLLDDMAASEDGSRQ